MKLAIVNGMLLADGKPVEGQKHAFLCDFSSRPDKLQRKLNKWLGKGHNAADVEGSGIGKLTITQGQASPASAPRATAPKSANTIRNIKAVDATVFVSLVSSTGEVLFEKAVDSQKSSGSAFKSAKSVWEDLRKPAPAPEPAPVAPAPEPVVAGLEAKIDALLKAVGNINERVSELEKPALTITAKPRKRKARGKKTN